MSVAVEFHEIVKSFGPVRVLHNVSFALEPGRIYALIGENGAGKSTLMKILAGYEAPSGGELRINGRPVHFSGPRAAEAEGIVMIHQEFNLAEDLSIAQNIRAWPARGLFALQRRGCTSQSAPSARTR
jgi:ribose transport system ATP-binding protein